MLNSGVKEKIIKNDHMARRRRGRNLKHLKKKNIHNSLCEILAEEIRNRYDYDNVTTNVEYELGEEDVHASNNVREVYFEIKSNYKKKNYQKATEQTLRWTQYMKQHYPQKDYYGVYHTKTLTKLICKNGYKR